MSDLCTYRIRLRGTVDGNDLNGRAPVQVIVVRAGPKSTQISLRTDQSGLIGLLRHLHGLGFVLLSVIRNS